MRINSTETIKVFVRLTTCQTRINMININPHLWEVKDLERFFNSIFSSIEMTPELSYEPTTVDPGPLSVKQENNSQEYFYIE